MQTAAIATNKGAAPVKNEVRAGKYLTFHLGAEEYGIRVLQVREIIGVQDITGVPQTPRHLKGVINLRGKVIPVVELRLKFGMTAGERTSGTCIIVVETRRAGGACPIGLLVDGVCEVVSLAAPDIEETPDFAGSLPAPFLMGLARTKDKVRILLDIDAVLGMSDLQPLDTVVTTQS
jgi:purine-binding chemotaxis protein CheW